MAYPKGCPRCDAETSQAARSGRCWKAARVQVETPGGGLTLRCDAHAAEAMKAGGRVVGPIRDRREP